MEFGGVGWGRAVLQLVLSRTNATNINSVKIRT